MGYSIDHTKISHPLKSQKDTYIRNRGSRVIVRDHRKRLGRFERARFIFPHWKYRRCSLMNLMNTEKVEYLKGTGLSTQPHQPASTSWFILWVLTQIPFPRWPIR